jgi:hypothetical protein
MRKASPPFKLALAALFLDGARLGAAEAFSALEPEYGDRRFFSAAFVENALQSLRAVGILTSGEEGGEEGGPRYALTAYGRERTLGGL